MFALLMETYAMIQLSILLFVIKQMSRNVASMFYFYVSAEPLAATRRAPVENHCSKVISAGKHYCHLKLLMIEPVVRLVLNFLGTLSDCNAYLLSTYILKCLLILTCAKLITRVR